MRPMLMQEKIKLSENSDDIFPHVRMLFQQTLQRAGMTGLDSIKRS